jgi:hypothetical protein
MGTDSPGISPRPANRPNPVAAIAVIIYASYALLALAIPQAMVNWVKDLNPGTVQDVMLGAAESVQSLATRLAADRPYRIARDMFLSATGKSD